MNDKMPFSDRLQHGWNAFKNKDPANGKETTNANPFLVVNSSTTRPDKPRQSYSIDSTMINSIFNRIAVDSALATFEHIKTDADGGYVSTIPSGLNDIFNVEANVDQSGQEFLIDLVLSLLDTGVVACVPVDTKTNFNSEITAQTIETMRVGKIVNWHPEDVDVDLYNDKTGNHQTIRVAKRYTAIITNPFYNVMNNKNSTLSRLNRRLSFLDVADAESVSSNLDLLVQLPYSVKNEMKKNQANDRREAIVEQLRESEYGIAYIDGTEKIIQLNRPIANNLMSSIEYLTKLLFDQLGLSPAIINMTAGEQEMINYYKRLINPINDAIVNEFKRKFLTKTARTQNQTVWYYTDPFAFTPMSSLADIADKVIRNRILTSNEMRGVIGYKPIDDPEANMLINPNMPQATQVLPESSSPGLEDYGEVDPSL